MKAWQVILCSLALYGFSVYQYLDLAEFEAEGGRKTVNAVTAALYNVGGKWLAILPFLALATYLMYRVVRTYLKPRDDS